jgi:Flp pilus assembly protein TadB
MTEHDLKTAWQMQATDSITLSPHQLQSRAESFARTVRRRNRREYIAGAFAIAVFAFYFWWLNGVILRAGNALLILGMLFVLYQLRRRGESRSSEQGDWGIPCLTFHRAELVRQRDALRSAWAWYVLPPVPGLVVFIWGVATESPGGRIGGAWTAIAVALVLVAVAVLNRWAASRLQREIDRLDQNA